MRYSSTPQLFSNLVTRYKKVYSLLAENTGQEILFYFRSVTEAVCLTVLFGKKEGYLRPMLVNRESRIILLKTF